MHDSIPLERLDDPHVVALLLQVRGDQRERTSVRGKVLQGLKNGPVPTWSRPLVEEALWRRAADDAFPDLGFQAVVALAEFYRCSRRTRRARQHCPGRDDTDRSALLRLHLTGAFRPTWESVHIMTQLFTDEIWASTR
jgi:hypothetical protein